MVVLACAHPPEPQPPFDAPAACNVMLLGSADYEGLQDELITALKLIEPLTLTSPTALCSKLEGWMLVVMPKPAWMDEWGRGVQGLCYCDDLVIKIGNQPWPQSSLAHELVHVAECPWTNVQHLGWGLEHDRLLETRE